MLLPAGGLHHFRDGRTFASAQQCQNAIVLRNARRVEFLAGLCFVWAAAEGPFAFDPALPVLPAADAVARLAWVAMRASIVVMLGSVGLRSRPIGAPTTQSPAFREASPEKSAPG